MKFRYIGEEYTEWFGHKWITGTVNDVADEHAIRKLSGSVLFEKVEECSVPEPVAETVAEQPKPRKQRKAAEVTVDGDTNTH